MVLNHVFKRAVTIVALSAIACLSLTSCSMSLKANQGVISRLKNRGPVAVSQDNPYLAANVLLTNEMQSSPELKGFLEKRGLPDALQVQHEPLSELRMELYYLSDRSFYSLEEGAGTWLIRGPESLSDERALAVQRVSTTRPRTVPTPTPPEPTGLPPLLTPAPASGAFRSPVIHTPLPTAAPSLREDDSQIVARLIRGHERSLAELSPRGDIVHYVTFPEETLVLLSRWYTFDAGNVGKLARINKMKMEGLLRLGDTVIIPSYLVRNKVRLTEDAARSFPP